MSGRGRVPTGFVSRVWRLASNFSQLLKKARRGTIRPIRQAALTLRDRLTELGLGLDTFVNSPEELRRYDYEPMAYAAIDAMTRMMQPKASDVLYDIGCGKGRVVCRLAQSTVLKCVGVEISPELARIAERNAEALQGKRAPIEIIEGDAVDQNYDEGTIFVLYNPFPLPVMTRFLASLRGSVNVAPRKIRIFYANPVARAAFEEAHWLVKVAEFPVVHRGWKMPVDIWASS
jgi:SAM-dependent methyltransferase